VIKLAVEPGVFFKPANLPGSTVLVTGTQKMFLAIRRPDQLEIMLFRPGREPRALDTITCERSKRSFRWLNWNNESDMSYGHLKKVLKQLGFNRRAHHQLRSKKKRRASYNAQVLEWSNVHIGILHKPEDRGNPQIIIYTRVGEELFTLDSVKLVKNISTIGTRKMFEWAENSIGAAFWPETRNMDMADTTKEAMSELARDIAALGFNPEVVKFAFMGELDDQ
jgi:hypothetical protein